MKDFFEESIFTCIQREEKIEQESKENLAEINKIVRKIGAQIIDIQFVLGKAEVHVMEGIYKIAENLGVNKVNIADRKDSVFQYRRYFDFYGVLFFELVNVKDMSEEELNEAV